MKNIRTIGIFVVLFFAVTCIITTVSFAQGNVITLRYSNFMPPGDPQSEIGDQWCKEVEKRTNGRIQVRYYPGGQLNSMPQMYESVIKDVADIGNVMTGLTTSRFPFMQALWTLPIDYPNSLVATRIANAVYAKFTPKEFDDVKVLYWHVSPQANLHTVKKPVLKVEDMKGMKIRVGDSPAKIVAQFGAAPVMLPMAEVYDGLSKGVIDGVVSVYEALKTFKTGDMLRYTTEIKGMAFTGVYAVAMNKNKWNSIPPDLQKIIEEINKEWAEKQGKLWDVKEQEGKEYGISKGLKIVKLSAEEQAKWDAKAKPLTDEYIANMKKANLPGEELLKFVSDYLKTAPLK